MARARATKPDILRATARQEARGAPNAAARSRFVPSTQTVLRGAAAAAALAATAATVAAGIHALNNWRSSYNPSSSSRYTPEQQQKDGFFARHRGPQQARSQQHAQQGSPPAPVQHRHLGGSTALSSPSAPTAKPRRVATSGKMNKDDLWFKDLFGFVDNNGTGEAAGPNTFEYYQQRFEYDKENGTLKSKHAVGTQWQAGQFDTPSLSELRKASTAMRAERESQAAKTDNPITETTVTFVSGDVAILHGNPDYAGAVFQAASQFNCLEFLSAESTPEHGVATYVRDKTQGPACAISCAPGTIVRNYFGRNGFWPQTSANQIENLGGVITSLSREKSVSVQSTAGRSLVTVKNGYTSATKDDLITLNERIKDLGPRTPSAGTGGSSGSSGSDRETMMDRLRVGVQRDTQVTCTKLATGKDEPWYKVSAREPVLVTQVYASALSVQYAIADGNTTKKDWAPFAQLVLDAAYEATLHAAVLYARPPEANGRRKVVLTALGGGVFGNEPAWISAAIVRALKLFKNAGLDVVINEYDPGTPAYKEIRRAIEAEFGTKAMLQPDGAFGREANEANKAKPRPVAMYTE